jgi:hypothetical protein
MELTLIVQSGESSGKRYALARGHSLRIGRNPSSDVCILDDPMLSADHFSIEFLDDAFVLHDGKSRFGTLLNGRSIMDSALQTGDEIRAGRTRFTIEVIGEPVPGALSPLDAVPPTNETSTEMKAAVRSSRAAAALAFFQQKKNIFAILDGARNPTILKLLKACGLPHQSLYDGEKGEQLAPYGPWLVELPTDGTTLERILAEGWGKTGAFSCRVYRHSMMYAGICGDFSWPSCQTVESFTSVFTIQGSCAPICKRAMRPN